MTRWTLRTLFIVLVLAGHAVAERWPDGYPLHIGSRFRPLYPTDPDRPVWLFSTGRGIARTPDGSREWVVYEAALDRRPGYHHLIVELALTAKPTDLFVRLLDGNRRVVSADVFGSIPTRAPMPGNVFLTLPLNTYPNAAVIQLLIPADEESALAEAMLSPASYEVLYTSAGNFASAARAWVRTPVFDSKNIAMLSDLVLLEEGRAGDLSTPIATFQAYGVDARILGHVADDAETAARFSLDAMPLLARLDLVMQLVDPLCPPVIWLNGAALGPPSIDAPDLEDAAYHWNEDAGAWRIGRFTRAWIFIPPDALRIGDNHIALRACDAEGGHRPLLVTSGIQLKYPWEEIATYSFVTSRWSTRDEPIAENISRAPAATATQEEDVFIFRTDGFGYEPIEAASARPPWLARAVRIYTDEKKREKQFILVLNPTNRPARLGVDIIVLGGARSPVAVSLWSGDRLVAPNVLTLALDCRYAQCSEQLSLPLEDFPDADTVRIDVRASPGMNHAAAISRLQLRAGWPAAVLALGERTSSDALLNIPYDTRSAFVPAEVLTPGANGGATTNALTPSSVTGAWYGVETRMLESGTLAHGDAHNRYFSEWTVEIDEPQLLARVDLLVRHVSVTDGLELFVNGERAGPLSLHLPGAQDANFMIFHVNRISADGTRLTNEERYAIDYGAWARASIVFDGRLLKAGTNTISIGRTPRLKGTNDHYSMKQIRLQLKPKPGGN